MWRFVSAGPAREPLTVEDARRQCNLDACETDFDEKLMDLLGAARRHAEKYCNAYFAARDVVVSFDRWSELDRLPLAPVNAIAEIAYTDPAGTARTLGADACDVLYGDDDRLEAALHPKSGAWPAIGHGSRILATLNVGFAVPPPPVRNAMLMLVARWMAGAEGLATSEGEMPAGVGDMLVNYRRGA